MKSTKKSLFFSALTLLLCLSMLIGSTFAWFTDKVEVTGNRIQAGNLDIEMFYKNASVTDWANVNTVSEDEPKFFLDVNGKDIEWEPGAVAYASFKVENVGNLALKYVLKTVADNFNTVADTDKSLKDVLTVAVPDTVDTSSREALIASIENATEFESFGFNGEVLEEGDYEEFTVVIYWEPSAADNEYNLKDGKTSSDGEALWINLDFVLSATQATVENDSFDNLYDTLADYSIYATQSKKLSPGADSVEFSLLHKNTVIATVSVPASAIADTSKAVTVTVDGINPSETIVVSDNTKSFAYDINVTNLKENLTGDQLVTVVLTAPNALPAVKTYHKGNLMGDATYDEVAGTVTFKTDSFSPFAVSYDYYEAATIAQLREYSAIDDAYIKLTADMDLNLDPAVNEGKDCDEGHKAVLSGVYDYYNAINIKGTNITIDLNGHTLAVQGGENGAYTVGAVFFVQPESSLNIADTKGNGGVMAKDPCYIVWAPYAEPSYCDIYGGIFMSHEYANSENQYSMIYAGEGGRINVYSGFFLYNNKPNDDTNTTNGAFNVMDNYIPEENPCITVHDGVMLINQYYRQSTGTDDETVKLAEGCEIVEVTLDKAVAGYTKWYQVQCAQERFTVNSDSLFIDNYSFGADQAVPLGSIFKQVNDAVINSATVQITVSPVGGSTVSGTYRADYDWTKSTITFNGSGKVQITIKPYSQGKATSVEVEITDKQGGSDDGGGDADEW